MRHGGNVWQRNAPEKWQDHSANLRPEGPPDWVKEALLRGMENTRYYPDPEMKRAKAALTEYLGLPAECVLPTAGGISAIRLANMLTCSETVLLTPCFGEYEQFAKGPVRKVSLLSTDRKLALPEDMELKENSLVWLCDPMNPVGYAFERKETEALLRHIEDRNSFLAVDEAFIGYCPECSVAALVTDHEDLLITGSLTKILGIPGVRLGYLCAHPRILEKLKAYQPAWELNCFAEAVALALPGHKADIREDAAKNAENREKLAAGLRELGFYVYPSRSACVLADLKRPAAPVAAALKKRQILVRECTDFDGINDGNHLRLAVRDEASNEKLIEALREVMLCAENV